MPVGSKASPRAARSASRRSGRKGLPALSWPTARARVDSASVKSIARPPGSGADGAARVGRRVAPGPPVSQGMSARGVGRPAPDAGWLPRNSRPWSTAGPARSLDSTGPSATRRPLASRLLCQSPASPSGRRGGRGVEPLPGFEGLVGQSAGMQTLFDRIRRVAPYDVPVLILGETGTGKELVAAALHRLSRRRSAPVRGRELRGAHARAPPERALRPRARGVHRRRSSGGPGLLREADGGTVFLDEVGELAPDAQAMLLRFLGDGEVRAVGASRAGHVDVRLIAATHRDLRAAVGEGRFREDLYYRLRRVVLTVPPLRARLDDLPLLVEHVRRQVNARHGLADRRRDGRRPRAASRPTPGPGTSASSRPCSRRRCSSAAAAGSARRISRSRSPVPAASAATGRPPVSRARVSPASAPRRDSPSSSAGRRSGRVDRRARPDGGCGAQRWRGGSSARWWPRGAFRRTGRGPRRAVRPTLTPTVGGVVSDRRATATSSGLRPRPSPAQRQPPLTSTGFGLGVVGPRLPEVRPHPSPQRRRLAHVDHLRLGALGRIHPGRSGRLASGSSSVTRSFRRRIRRPSATPFARESGPG